MHIRHASKIFVSGFVIFLDVVVIILAFTNVHIIKEPLQNFSYALKLQLEFFVLNQLMAVSGDGFASSPSGGRAGRRNRCHVPKTTSDASKTPVLEKNGGSGSGDREMSQSSAQRMASSNDASVSSNGKERRAPNGPWGSASTARTAVVTPATAYLRDQSGSSPIPPGLQHPVSPIAPSPVGKVEEELIIPHMASIGHFSALDRSVVGRAAAPTDVAKPRASSRTGSRLDRALPPSPPLLEGHVPARSWLDLEERLIDVERRLNALA